MKLKTLKYFTVGTVLVSSMSLLAQESTAVLPENIHRARVVGIMTDDIDTTFNDRGQEESLLKALSQSVTMNQIIGGQKDPMAKFGLTALKDYLNAVSGDKKLGDNLYQVDLVGDSKINASQIFYAYEYGLTSDLSIGIKVPQVIMDVTADYKVGGTQDNFAAAKKAVAGNATLAGVLGGFEKAVTSGAAAKGALLGAQAMLTSNGYEVPDDFSKNGLGDAEIGAVYRYFKSTHFDTIVELGLRLPTSKLTSDGEREQAKLLDTGLGDGSYDLGLKLNQDIKITNNFVFGTSLRYTWQIPDSIDWSVKKKGSLAPLANLNDPSLRGSVDRDLGDMIESEVALSYKFFDGFLKPHVAYKFNWQDNDRYKGSNAALDYASLNETSAHTHAYQVGLNISSIPFYKKKQFFVPGELRLKWNQAIDGKNSAKTSYARADLMVYF